MQMYKDVLVQPTCSLTKKNELITKVRELSYLVSHVVNTCTRSNLIMLISGNILNSGGWISGIFASRLEGDGLGFSCRYVRSRLRILGCS